MTYELVDDRGQAVGRIELPGRELLIGPHAGTVLLRRELPSTGRQTGPDATGQHRAA